MDRINRTTPATSTASSSSTEQPVDKPLGQRVTSTNTNTVIQSGSSGNPGGTTGFFGKLFNLKSGKSNIAAVGKDNEEQMKLEEKKRKIQRELLYANTDGISVFEALKDAIKLGFDFKDIFPSWINHAVVELYFYCGENIYKRNDEIFKIINRITTQIPKDSPCYPTKEMIQLLSEYQSDSKNKNLTGYFDTLYFNFKEDFNREVKFHLADRESLAPFEHCDSIITKEMKLLFNNIRNGILMLTQRHLRHECEAEIINQLASALIKVDLAIKFMQQGPVDDWKKLNIEKNERYLGRLINIANTLILHIMGGMLVNDVSTVFKIDTLDNSIYTRIGCSQIYRLNENTQSKIRCELLSKARFPDSWIKSIENLDAVVKDIILIK